MSGRTEDTKRRIRAAAAKIRELQRELRGIEDCDTYVSLGRDIADLERVAVCLLCLAPPDDPELERRMQALPESIRKDFGLMRRG